MAKSTIEELKAKAKTANSEAKRRKLIATFYELIRSGAEVRMFNKDLKRDIYITSRSSHETRTHASKSTKSTLAVFELLDILKNAKKVKEVQIKTNTTNQQKFKKMIILSYNVKGIGRVKLTVGVLKGNDKHIQYCLTALK